MKKEIVMTAKRADVTTAQVGEIRRMAISKGIPRDVFQVGLGTVMPRALDAIKSGSRIKILLPIVAPLWGGRIHFVDNVPVDLGQEWQAAINDAGPDTPDHFNVRKLGYLYPATRGVVTANFVLVSLAGGGSYHKALDWAKQFDLPGVAPRHIFSLARHKPNLCRELGMDPAFVVSPVACTFQCDARVCVVWFHGSRREASARWVGGLGGAYDWVAFLR